MGGLGVELAPVRKLAITAGVAATLLGRSAPAVADEVDDLVRAGETFAKQGEWTQAITAFKAADAQRPAAKHACLIGLAYTRRELWPQAEIFFERCRARATTDAPVPEWLDDAERTLAEKLATSRSTAVTITVTPTTTLAQIEVSAFAPDETFSPRTIHLAPGTYTLTALAPNHRTVKQTLVVDGTVPELAIELVLVPLADVPRPRAPSRVPTSVMGVGGAIVGLGVVHHVLLTRPSRDRLAGSTNASYDLARDEFLSRRRLTLALYGIGVLSVATGLVLRYTVFKRDQPSVEIGATANHGGASVTIGWRR